MNYSQKYKKYKNKYLELKNLFQRAGAAGGVGGEPVYKSYELERCPIHIARPFVLGERVIAFRSRIAKIISICQNGPEINDGKITYNIHYVDTVPRELKTNIAEEHLIRLPTDINPGDSRYKILQIDQEVMWGTNKGTIVQIRDNKNECYKVFIPTLGVSPSNPYPGKQCIPRKELKEI
jgi:hypothetical protein